MKKGTPEYNALLAELVKLLNDQDLETMQGIETWINSPRLRVILNLTGKHKDGTGLEQLTLHLNFIENKVQILRSVEEGISKAPLCISPSGQHAFIEPEEEGTAFLVCEICEENFYLVSETQFETMGTEAVPRPVNSNN